MKSILYLVLLVGCSVGPTYHRPELSLPCCFECSDDACEPWVCWWQNLEDPVLDALIAKALECNFNFKAAIAHVDQLRAKYVMSQSRLWPHLSMGFEPGAWKLSDSYPFLTLDERFDTFDFAFDVSWEIDIFGKHRRLAQAHFAEYQAQEAFAKSIGHTLISELARTYVQLRSYQKQKLNTQKMVSIQEQLAELMSQKVEQKLSSGIELSSVKKSLLKTRSTLPALDDVISESINAIKQMLSHLPQHVVCELESPSSMPILPSSLPVGLPSTLICRRPDIIEAEKKLEATVAQVGYCVADFFPVFDVLAKVGFFSTHLPTLFAAGNDSETVLGGILLPLFKGGQMVGQYKAARADQCRAIYHYQDVVLKAFHDVDNALNGYRNEKERYTQILSMKQEQSANGFRVDEMRKEGLGDKAQVLKEQLALIEVENQEIASYAKRVNYFIALYKALGGGWCE